MSLSSSSSSRPDRDPAVSSSDDCADDSSDEASSTSDVEPAAGNQFIRKTVIAINDRATDLAATVPVVKSTFDSVGRLVVPVFRYADPIVTSLDDRIDAVISAIRTMTVANPSGTFDRTQHWMRLKQTFVSSQWFRKVQDILTPTHADTFYTTATQCYFDCGSEVTSEQFLETLRERMGDMWDPRLLSLARVFYATAKTAASIVGVGRFFKGAFGLGRAKLNHAFEHIIERWDKMLGATDTAVDRWLPELDEVQRASSHSESSSRIWPAPPGTSAAANRSSSGGVEASAGSTGDDTASPDEDTDHSSPAPFGNKRRSVSDIASTLTRRVRQRLSPGVREKLGQARWCQTVDEILLENVFVRSLVTASPPSEHFFNTCAGLLHDAPDVDAFVGAVKRAVGDSWDGRLDEPVRQFYHVARP
ncbi:Uncharacterized protein PBTT_01713 [Plasmodiophora brassicae]|nr:hypothetical protein PBRA_006462 [Plasmodiophora brassicae]